MKQRDTNGLNAENSELKLRLQTMEQQVHLQDGKNLSMTSFSKLFAHNPPPLFICLNNGCRFSMASRVTLVQVFDHLR